MKRFKVELVWAVDTCATVVVETDDPARAAKLAMKFFWAGGEVSWDVAEYEPEPESVRAIPLVLPADPDDDVDISDTGEEADNQEEVEA